MKKQTTRRALVLSVLSLFVCVAMLIGTTFAWFTDSVTSGRNTIQSGNLDVELYYAESFADVQADNWTPVDKNTDAFGEDNWEPGFTKVVYFKVVNAGSLALKYQLAADVYKETAGINKAGDSFLLSDYLYTAVIDAENAITREDVLSATGVNFKDSFAIDNAGSLAANAEEVVGFAIWMPTSVGNEANHNGTKPSIEFGINLVATQEMAEYDSFGKDYDKDATYPVIAVGTVAGEDTDVIANDIIVTVPEEAGDGEYKVVVDNKNVTKNANDEVSVSFEIELEKDGVPVVAQPGVEYDVKINVGASLLISEVLHKGEEVTTYTYDSVSGIISFTVSDFSPFSIVYIEVPVGAMTKVVAADGKVKFYTDLESAFANVTDGAVINLMDNVTLTETLVFDNDVSATLNMCGYTISAQIDTLFKISAGKLSISNGAFKNEHAAATETKTSIYMCGDAVAEIKDVEITTSGTGIYMADNAKITELNATVYSYMNANGYCVFDAISMVDSARIDLISGGEYETCYSDAFIQSWFEDPKHTYSGMMCYTVNLNGDNASIGEIAGGTFLGIMDKANNGTPIHVNNGFVDEISGGYFGFSKKGLSNPIRLMYIGSNASINKITGGTFEKGSLQTGFGCDFAGIVDASGCQAIETGETVSVNIQFSTKVTTYTLKVLEVVAK